MSRAKGPPQLRAIEKPSPTPEDEVLAAAARQQAYLRFRPLGDRILAEEKERRHLSALLPSTGALLVELERAFRSRYPHGREADLPKALEMLAAALRATFAVGLPRGVDAKTLAGAVRRATHEILRRAGWDDRDPFTDDSPAWKKGDPSPRVGDGPHQEDGPPVRALVQQDLDEHAARNPAGVFHVDGFKPFGASNVKQHLERELAAFLRARTADDQLVVAWVVMKTRDNDIASLLRVSGEIDEHAWNRVVHRARVRILDDERRRAKRRDRTAAEAAAVVSAVLSAQGVPARKQPRPRATRRRD